MAGVDLAALVQAVRDKDFMAQITARQGGADAVDALTPLLSEPEFEVRLLAIYCIAETGQARAADALIPMTLDTNPQIAVAAAQRVHLLSTAQSVPAILRVLPDCEEPLVRRELALALGKVAGPGKIPEMREQLARETSQLAYQGMLAALARLGDDESRKTFAHGLHDTEGMARKSWLDLVEEIGQPWLIAPLAGALGDPAPIIRIGVDALPDFPDALRACDLAVNLIAKIAARSFSFEMTDAKNYSAEELDEVKRFAESS